MKTRTQVRRNGKAGVAARQLNTQPFQSACSQSSAGWLGKMRLLIELLPDGIQEREHALTRMLKVIPEREEAHSVAAMALHLIEEHDAVMDRLREKVGRAVAEHPSEPAQAPAPTDEWGPATDGAMNVFHTLWTEIDKDYDPEHLAAQLDITGEVIEHCPELREVGALCRRVACGLNDLVDLGFRMNRGEFSGPLVKSSAAQPAEAGRGRLVTASAGGAAAQQPLEKPQMEDEPTDAQVAVGFLAGEWRGVRALCPEPALSEFVGRLYELEEVLKYHPELKHAARACAAICSGINYLDSANSANSGGPAGLPEFALQERVHAGP